MEFDIDGYNSVLPTCALEYNLLLRNLILLASNNINNITGKCNNILIIIFFSFYPPISTFL